MKWTKHLPMNPSDGHGLNMCFNRHSGYGGYSDWTRGGRKIIAVEDLDELETWMRLEDGSISGHIMLNSTYGTDEYPAVTPMESPGW
jgi:hypothetical protein